MKPGGPRSRLLSRASLGGAMGGGVGGGGVGLAGRLRASARVPSAFDVQPPYRHARGTAFYRARVRVTRGRTAELRFGACALTCR